MHKATKQAWVKSLRSGVYKQGYGCLRKNDQFCCLGVLCEVLSVPKHEQGDGSFTYNGAYAALPDYKILDGKLQQKLIDMNDHGDFSFNEIADYIEKNIPEEE